MVVSEWEKANAGELGVIDLEKLSKLSPHYDAPANNNLFLTSSSTQRSVQATGRPVFFPT